MAILLMSLVAIIQIFVWSHANINFIQNIGTSMPKDTRQSHQNQETNLVSSN